MDITLSRCYIYCKPKPLENHVKGFPDMPYRAFHKIAFLLISFTLAALAATPSSAQRRIALVIGNDGYENVAVLQKARNDAKAMAEMLTKIGFEVVKAENLGRRAMSRAVLELEKRIESQDLVLFFYAGHGFAVDGQNYLLPVDIPAAGPGEGGLIRDEAFLADELADRFRNAGASTAILILDACRDNPFKQPGKRSLAGTRGLARMSPAEGVFVLFSAGQNQAALDRLNDQDPHPNSVFTRSLLQELERPQASIVDIAKTTQVKVRALASKVGHVQTPAYYDQIIGNVVLNPGTGEFSGKGKVDGFGEGKTALLLPKFDVNRPKDGPAPIANFSRSNAGWTVTVSLPEPAVQFGYRVGEKGTFTDTGTQDWIDPRTGQRMPVTHFSLSADQKPVTLYVTWRDKRGEEAGTHPIAFDPDTALKSGMKKTLKTLWTAWISFREYNGLLVYFTHLVTNRCAIKEVRYALDDSGNFKAFPLPPCDPAKPYNVPQRAKTYKKLPRGTKSMSVVLTYFDGQTSPTRKFNVTK